MRRTIVVVAETPFPCTAEQPLEPAASARLRECLLLDTLEKAHSTPDAEVFIACAPNGSVSYFRDAAPNVNGYIEQGDGETGELLETYFQQFCEPNRSVVVLQNINPTLPAMSLELAFDILDTSQVDIVLGPLEDGKCYLTGMNECRQGLFAGIDPNAPSAIDKVIERCAQRSLDWYLLPKWHSVDDTTSLNHLKDDLLSGPEDSPSAQHTRDFLLQQTEAEKI